ncbi:MAG TPA: PhzF family isomerase [Candidatus Acidoferrales bacterium]|nr:PhzF family isomerase [Candidatus Acidoferrales bacterium]
MSKKLRVYQVDAFTSVALTGNPAGVVPDAAGLTEAQMQAIARELNNSETAFLLPPSSADHDVWVRFFTPTMEVPICGHATIAAHYIRARELGMTEGRVLQRTGAGILPVEIERNGDDLEIIMTQGEIKFEKVLEGADRETLLRALGISEADLDARCPIQIVSTGHSKVLIGIKEHAKLNSLKPNLSELAKLSGAIGCNGYFVFTLSASDKAFLAEGRMLAPAIGINEDPVTGNANGPLGAYLVHHRLVAHDGKQLTFYTKQGAAMGRPGKVRVVVDIEAGEAVKVRVAGRATVAFQTEMEIG